jgi:DNA-directed RNA polymerase subunit omega
MHSEATVIIETPELNRFQLVLLAAQRAKEINNGSDPLVTPRRHKATSIALEEVMAGKVAVTSEPPVEEAVAAEDAPEVLTPIEQSGEGSAASEG